jgi:hypothetical protein
MNATLPKPEPAGALAVASLSLTATRGLFDGAYTIGKTVAKQRKSVPYLLSRDACKPPRQAKKFNVFLALPAYPRLWPRPLYDKSFSQMYQLPGMFRLCNQ